MLNKELRNYIPNLSTDERTALSKLLNNKTITISTADKGTRSLLLDGKNVFPHHLSANLKKKQIHYRRTI